MGSLRTRIAGVSLLGSLGCVLLVQVAWLVAIHTEIQARLSDPQALLEPDALARCAEAPERWLASVGLTTLWAYRPDGRSENPSAPAMPPSWVPEAVGETRRPRLSTPLQGQYAVQRVAAEGPCAVLFVPPASRLPVITRARRVVAGGLSGGMLLVLLGTILFATRPLLVRLRRLVAVAELVGEDGFAWQPGRADDELTQLGRTLSRAHARIRQDQRELQRRHRELERHLAALAHDLRTPIATLQLTLEALGEQVTEPARAEVGEARLELAYLEALAENLLQAARLDGGLGVAGEVELVQLCERVAQRFRILGRARGVSVDIALPEPPLRAACDPALAERVLANLVHNALVHGPSQHPIGIALDRFGDRFRLTVASGGPPLATEALQQLRARRLSDRDPARTRHGDGLGVAIVNEIAARVGWEIAWEAGEPGGLLVSLSGSLWGDPPEGNRPGP